MTSKLCCHCKQEKSTDCFQKRGSGFQARCKECRKLQTSAYYAGNKEKHAAKNKTYYNNNKDNPVFKQQRKSIASRYNRKKVVDHAKHYAENDLYYRVKANMRKARLKQATPVWLSKDDKQRIKLIYTVAAHLSDKSGEAWHVDHIIPIKGDSVCGLHVPSNLRIVPAKDNLSKSNSFNGWQEWTSTTR